VSCRAKGVDDSIWRIGRVCWHLSAIVRNLKRTRCSILNCQPPVSSVSKSMYAVSAKHSHTSERLDAARL
jgi:hypothetical protein